MSPRLDGRVVLITGAGSGIGRATVLLAVQEGASVAAIDLDESCLRSTVDAVRALGGSIAWRTADVARRDALVAAIRTLAGEVGDFHGVFANAAILPGPVPVEDLDWQEWDRVLGVNLTGAVSTLVSALPHVAAAGSLVANGSSMAIRPREGRLAYVAAKAGLHAAAKALALELADRQIRVNVLAPGLTDTPMVRRIPGHVETGLPSVPLGELVAPEEVAELAVYLMSDAARHITGAVFSVDGGRTAG
ncbi:MAG TPA: SDR family oxidoreductase [Acidimicrobiia bacterium]|jgi:3-oxoacyl-[acyl-carrier protein] reductase